MESLTDEIERGACDYISEIDSLGGMVAAIERVTRSAKSPRLPTNIN